MINKLNTLLEKPLTPRHRDTVISLRRGLQKWGSLTRSQINFFEKIASEYTKEKLQEESDHSRKLREDSGYLEQVRIIAEYHQTTGYFSGVSRDSLSFIRAVERGDNSVPPPSLSGLSRMMDNKYAQNILESHGNNPKYAVGDMVQIRANQDSNIRRGKYSRRDLEKGVTFIIIEVDSGPITRSLTYNAKTGGTRWYRLLPLGSTDTIEAIEKAMKSVSKKALRGE